MHTSSARLLLALSLGLTACVPASAPSDDESVNALAPLPVSPSRYPIVLVHGFNASPSSKRAFSQRLVDHYTSLGQAVYVARVNPYSSTTQRAAELLEEVHRAEAMFGVSQVHLVGHSQGGLDARVLASPLGLGAGAEIRSVTTLSTPHHGTAIADLALRFVGDHGLKAGIERWLEDILSNGLDETAQKLCDAGACDMSAALEDMKEAGFEDRFNATYPDDPRVVYQSVGAAAAPVYGPVDATGCEVAPADDLSPESTSLFARGANDLMTFSLRFSSDPVGHYRHDPNDGVVTVASSKWGRFRGCLIDDHYGVLDQGRYAEAVDGDNGFEVLTFYDRLVSDLAARD